MNRVSVFILSIAFLVSCGGEKESSTDVKDHTITQEKTDAQEVSEKVVPDPERPFKQGGNEKQAYSITDTIDARFNTTGRGKALMSRYSQSDLEKLYALMSKAEIEGLPICSSSENGVWPPPCNASGFSAWPLNNKKDFSEGAIIEIHPKFKLKEDDINQITPRILVLKATASGTVNVTNDHRGMLVDIIVRDDGAYNIMLDHWALTMDGEMLDENRFGILHEWTGNKFIPLTVVDVGGDYVLDAVRDSIDNIYITNFLW